MIRVLLVDDHALFRAGIIKILYGDKDIAIIGEAEDGTTLLSKFYDLKPDVIVTDIAMPNRTGLDVIKTLTNKDREVKALFLSQYGGDDYIYQVIKAGGKGLIGKNVAKEDLVIAIKTVYFGGEYFFAKTDDEINALKKRYRMIENRWSYNEEVDIITKREREVLKLVSDGCSNEKIAIILKLSIRTVESHRYRLMNRLGIKSVIELLKYAEKYFKEYGDEVIIMDE